MKGQISSKSVGGGKVNVEGTYCISLWEYKFQENKIKVMRCVEPGGKPCQTSSHIIFSTNQHMIYKLYLVTGCPNVGLFSFALLDHSLPFLPLLHFPLLLHLLLTLILHSSSILLTLSVFNRPTGFMLIIMPEYACATNLSPIKPALQDLGSAVF